MPGHLLKWTSVSLSDWCNKKSVCIRKSDGVSVLENVCVCVCVLEREKEKECELEREQWTDREREWMCVQIIKQNFAQRHCSTRECVRECTPRLLTGWCTHLATVQTFTRAVDDSNRVFFSTWDFPSFLSTSLIFHLTSKNIETQTLTLKLFG